MMNPTKLFLLEPEVAGGWGPNTVVTNREQVRAGLAQVPDVAHLHYVFDGWLGDELLTTHPCFIVTQSLADTLRNGSLTGFRFDDVEITMSELYDELEPEQELPQFVRLLPFGTVEMASWPGVTHWSGHDFCLTRRAQLVVSHKAWEAISRHRVVHCRVRVLDLDRG